MYASMIISPATKESLTQHCAEADPPRNSFGIPDTAAGVKVFIGYTEVERRHIAMERIVLGEAVLYEAEEGAFYEAGTRCVRDQEGRAVFPMAPISPFVGGLHERGFRGDTQSTCSGDLAPPGAGHVCGSADSTRGSEETEGPEQEGGDEEGH